MFCTSYVQAQFDQSILPTSSFSVDDSVPKVSCSEVVMNVEALRSKLNAINTNQPKGYTLCLAPGTYRDVKIRFGGKGTLQQPITLAAQKSGTALLTGNVSVRLAGSHIVLQGLIFRGGNSVGDLISTRDGQTDCNYCRITDISIINFDYKNPNLSKWVNLVGRHNRVDHSWFTGKLNLGTLMMVDRREAAPNYARIDHNYFGYRPPYGGQRYPDRKDSDLEVIRVGSSRHHKESSFSRIEYNLFENVKGETEIVSVKSSQNIFHGNTVRGCYGLISNRHGSRSLYSNNFILGDGYPFAGGIRIMGSDHVIANNYLEQVGYAGSRQFGGIVFVSSFDPSNTKAKYAQVENVTIAHNTIVNSVNSIILNAGKRPNPPRLLSFFNNIVSNGKGAALAHSARGFPKDSNFDGNYFYADRLIDSRIISKVDGISYKDVMLYKSPDGLFRPKPSMNKSFLKGVSLSSDFVRLIVSKDMDGQQRLQNPIAGADAQSSDPIFHFPLDKDMVGPKHYRPDTLR